VGLLGRVSVDVYLEVADILSGRTVRRRRRRHFDDAAAADRN